MGLLDGLLDELLSAPRSDARQPTMQGMPSGVAGAAVSIGLQLLQQCGGVDGLVARFRQAGYAHEAASWVGTGGNLPIDHDALARTFDADALRRLAEQAGVAGHEGMGGLAAVLPQIIDRLTPGGRVETSSDDEVTKALAELRNRGVRTPQ